MEKEMATHSRILAWRIPGTEEPVGPICGVAQSQTWLTRLSSSSSREAWRPAIHGVAKSPTRLSDWTKLNWMTYNIEYYFICLLTICFLLWWGVCSDVLSFLLFFTLGCVFSSCWLLRIFYLFWIIVLYYICL